MCKLISVSTALATFFKSNLLRSPSSSPPQPIFKYFFYYCVLLVAFKVYVNREWALRFLKILLYMIDSNLEILTKIENRQYF